MGDGEVFVYSYDVIERHVGGFGKSRISTRLIRKVLYLRVPVTGPGPYYGGILLPVTLTMIGSEASRLGRHVESRHVIVKPTPEVGADWLNHRTHLITNSNHHHLGITPEYLATPTAGGSPIQRFTQ